MGFARLLLTPGAVACAVAWVLACAGTGAPGTGSDLPGADAATDPGSEPGGADAAGDDPTADPDGADARVPDEEVGDPEDAPGEDANDGAPDADGGDEAADATADPAGDDELWDIPPAGTFLSPCGSDADCDSGPCVPHAGGTVCSRECVADCPAGWRCKDGALRGAWAGASVCVSDAWALCRPCTGPTGCKAPWGGADLCVRYPSGTYHCGSPCGGAGQDCPDGYSCLETLSSAGKPVKQCVLAAGACACLAGWIDEALASRCEVSNAFGTCPGQSICASAGMTSCDAPEPKAEACDGVDSDCDGSIDEGLRGCCACGNGECQAGCG
ncbi:MAG: hypothetical protein FJ087_23370, partial [Deltaproteobacteria bacterium]|nr:hypothetical protein [Deltaproteobacteria bacterium]